MAEVEWPLLAGPAIRWGARERRLRPNFSCSKSHEHVAAFRKSQVATERLTWGRDLKGRNFSQARQICQTGFGPVHQPCSWPMMGGFLPFRF